MGFLQDRDWPHIRQPFLVHGSAEIPHKSTKRFGHGPRHGSPHAGGTELPKGKLFQKEKKKIFLPSYFINKKLRSPLRVTFENPELKILTCSIPRTCSPKKVAQDKNEDKLTQG